MIRRAVVVALVAAALLFGVRALRGPSPEALLGLWEAGAPRELSDPMRFYYFHKGGKGLYRYGQVGLNQTRSFDWSVSGDVLTLVFRKSGEKAQTKLVIETREGKSELVLANDPRNGGVQRYRRRPAQLDAEDGPLALDGTGMERMWIDHQKFATGGQGFVMYQLSAHGLAAGETHSLSGGAKLGWFHTGDFDDWSTETLAYRFLPGAVTFAFPLRGDTATTTMTTDGKTLTLSADPRDFYGRHRYSDGGPSF